MLKDQAAISFIKRVGQKYPRLEQKRLKQCIQVILVQLFKNLPPETGEQFFAALPEDIRSLTPSHFQEYSSQQAEPKKISRHDQRHFLSKIKLESALDDTEQIKNITYAVLSSLAELLPAATSFLVRSGLPANIKQLWDEALQEQAIYSLAMQNFQHEIKCHFTAAHEEQLKVIIRTVVTHLLQYCAAGNAARIFYHLPEEVRLLIGQEKPLRKETGQPAENLSMAELIQIVQQEANLINSEDARQALLGIFRAIKKATPPPADRLFGQTEQDWDELWQQA